jgi:hypothetical protein
VQALRTSLPASMLLVGLSAGIQPDSDALGPFFWVVAHVAVRDSDGFLFRVCYKATLLGREY